MPAGRPPPLLVAPSSPARPLPSASRPSPGPSNSPFRYVHFPAEKQRTPVDPLRAPAHPLASPIAPTPASPLQHRVPPPPPPPPLPTQARGRPAGFRIPDRLKPWLGLASWAVTSGAFLLALAFWNTEVFAGLDQLARYLQSLGCRGYAVLFCLIFITTIPPIPLYSTLIILSGYTFGTWRGALLSYAAALAGGTAVFLLARRFLQARMARLLAHTRTLQRAVRAIERRPRLLLLIRVAPYPYNVLNVLLAASRALRFRTFFACTAASLAKVVVHTSVGASLRSFAAYRAEAQGAAARAWTAGGLVLCVAIFVYLAYVARRAVDEELEGAGAGAGAEAWEAGRPARDAEEAGAMAATSAEMREVAAG